ncbi:MarR family winged helix-turn-helix transcriptional regulator [Flocculibacter collagenilyticus]|uniref:MarR family winged helix-turn-helix transcriptional regulator n=1 Tax=Flocculibacter collagenilyticus TaxID=2744479 RepID=UPI0018F70881|nr:MarR family transcriptional regulator [Flocculibacter collagenilyticus]
MTDNLKLSNQLCFKLYACSKEVTRLYRPLLAPLNLTYPQYLVMLVLWEADSPIAIKQIGKQLLLDTGTLTPLLKRLEANALITRERLKEDERVVVIKLTNQGKQLKAKAEDIPKMLACQSSLNLRELEQLSQVLEKLLNSMTPTHNK